MPEGGFQKSIKRQNLTVIWQQRGGSPGGGCGRFRVTNRLLRKGQAEKHPSVVRQEFGRGLVTGNGPGRLVSLGVNVSQLYPALGKQRVLPYAKQGLLFARSV